MLTILFPESYVSEWQKTRRFQNYVHVCSLLFAALLMHIRTISDAHTQNMFERRCARFRLRVRVRVRVRVWACTCMVVHVYVCARVHVRVQICLRMSTQMCAATMSIRVHLCLCL